MYHSENAWVIIYNYMLQTKNQLTNTYTRTYVPVPIKKTHLKKSHINTGGESPY